LKSVHTVAQRNRPGTLKEKTSGSATPFCLIVTHTNQRLGEQLETVAVLELETIEQARILERQLKARKNPKLAIAMLQSLGPPSHST
jgi:hypothetical protein